MAAKFELTSKFQPAGDQPSAIEKLVAGFRDYRPNQTLLGATGTGKTFTAANVSGATGTVVRGIDEYDSINPKFA